MITTEQIPPGWHPGMSEDEVIKALFECVRSDTHMDFVVYALVGIGKPAVELLVSATCNLRETTQHRVKFLNLIRQINGSLSQAQMRRLDADPACKDPVVRSTLSGLLEENGYRQIDKFLDDAAMDLLRGLDSKP